MCVTPSKTSKVGAGISLGALAYSVLTGDAITGAAVASGGGLVQTAGAGMDIYDAATKDEPEKKSKTESAPRAPSLFDQQIQQAGLAARRRMRGATGYQSMFLSGLDGTQTAGL